MDTARIKQCAENLERTLASYSQSDVEAHALEASLSDLIARGKQGAIVSPIEYQKVPGGYWFNEGGLRQYPDLEKAYVDFKFEITGGDSVKRSSLLKIIEGMQGKDTD